MDKAIPLSSVYGMPKLKHMHMCIQVLKDSATGEEITKADVDGLKEGDKMQQEIEKEDGDYDPENPAEEKAEEIPPDDAAAQEAVAAGRHPPSVMLVLGHAKGTCAVDSCPCMQL